MSDDQTTHFGYEKVKISEKAARVAGVFDSVATRYDLMNDLMSMGVHRLWKSFTIELSGARPGDRILDIAGGTGDLTAKFSRLVGVHGQVVLADINSSMLHIGRDKMINRGLTNNINYTQADAQFLPFADNSFNCITIAFGLRNVTDKEIALKSMFRILKPGGRLLVLEFSKPQNKLVEKAYDIYSFNVLPVMGKLVANDAKSYQYLAESIRMHPDQETLKQMLLDAGFSESKYYNLTGGIVAIHKGIKA